MTGNTFTNVLSVRRTAKRLIWLFIECGVQRKKSTMLLTDSTTAIPLSPNDF